MIASEYRRESKQNTSPLHSVLSGRTIGFLVLGLLVLGSSVGVVYIKHLNRKLHIELQQLQMTRDSLHVEWTQLLLEQSALGSDVRVERVAREQLGMVIPASSEVMVIKP